MTEGLGPRKKRSAIHTPALPLVVLEAVAEGWRQRQRLHPQAQRAPRCQLRRWISKRRKARARRAKRRRRRLRCAHADAHTDAARTCGLAARASE